MDPPRDRADMGADAEHFVLADHELDDEERGHSQLRPERESHDDDDGSPGYGGRAANDRRYSYDEDDDADEIKDEKRFKYFQELPNARDLRDSRPKIPGAFPIASGLVLLVCVGYLIAWICTSITRYSHVTKVNVILMVSDGFGPASETFAREYLQYLIESNHPSIQAGGRWASLVPESGPTDYRMILPLDSILIGSSRTRSSDSLVTDSAAGATAFSCALKTYNGAIGVEPSKRDPCGTVLEAAKHQGYQTGLVVTSRITHATPASFYAHVPDRDMEARIAEQLVSDHPLGQQVDLAFGGGLCFFLPNTSTTSCRADDKDLIEAARNKLNNNPRLSVITSRQEFDDLPADASSIGTIGLFNRDHMEYEIDRLAMSEIEGEREPTLADMAEKAIKILRASVSRSSAHGFFLMIEGSRIDMAGHSNDPVGHVHEILSYQATVQKVQAQVDEMNAAGNPSLLVSVSDHETGGLSLGRQLDNEVYPTYAWYPDVLVNGTRTSVKVAQAIREQADTIDIEGVRSLLQNQLGVSDADDEEIAAVLKDKDDTTLWFLDHTLSKLTSRRAQVGWSTEGHSGVDVNLYGYPRALVAPSLGGSRENTEIGVFIATTMKLNLKQITKSLQNNIKTWYNSTTPKLDNLSVDRGHGTGSVAHYHGEHRH